MKPLQFYLKCLAVTFTGFLSSAPVGALPLMEPLNEEEQQASNRYYQLVFDTEAFTVLVGVNYPIKATLSPGIDRRNRKTKSVGVISQKEGECYLISYGKGVNAVINSENCRGSEAEGVQPLFQKFAADPVIKEILATPLKNKTGVEVRLLPVKRENLYQPEPTTEQPSPDNRLRASTTKGSSGWMPSELAGSLASSSDGSIIGDVAQILCLSDLGELYLDWIDLRLYQPKGPIKRSCPDLGWFESPYFRWPGNVKARKLKIEQQNQDDGSIIFHFDNFTRDRHYLYLSYDSDPGDNNHDPQQLKIELDTESYLPSTTQLATPVSRPRFNCSVTNNAAGSSPTSSSIRKHSGAHHNDASKVSYRMFFLLYMAVSSLL